MGQESWYQYASGGGVGIPLPPCNWIGLSVLASSDTVTSEDVGSEDMTKASAPTSTAAAVRIQARVFTKSS